MLLAINRELAIAYSPILMVAMVALGWVVALLWVTYEHDRERRELKRNRPVDREPVSTCNGTQKVATPHDPPRRRRNAAERRALVEGRQVPLRPLLLTKPKPVPVGPVRRRTDEERRALLKDTIWV